MPAPIGAPCWTDLLTSDTAGAAAFYGELFGWEAEAPNPDFGGYFNFTKDGARVAGCMGQMRDSEQPDTWSTYLSTTDAAHTVGAAQARSGQVIVPAMAVGDLGTMAVVTDSDSAAIGVWQPGLHTGFGVRGEPGTPRWFELHTRDYGAAVDFYRDVFGWNGEVVSDTPEFRMTAIADGETRLAGIMDASAYLPEGVPSHWAVYFGTDDLDAALATVERLGGTITAPAMDTPYGAIAGAADRTGAAFKLVA